MSDLQAQLEAKAQRDVIRAMVIDEIARLPGASQELKALLVADQEATQLLNAALKEVA